MAEGGKGAPDAGKCRLMRPSLDDIFDEPDEFGLLDVKPRSGQTAAGGDKGLQVTQQVNAFYATHGRAPSVEAADHDEMRLAIIWAAIARDPSPRVIEADVHGLLSPTSPPQPSWRDEPFADAVPDSLDDIFDEDDLEVDPSLVTLKHTTAAADRHRPDHRADFVPCRDFERYHARFEQMQTMLEDGEREATPVKKWAVIEPLEGDFFIRNGLLALIAEKSEMTTRGGSRDHRLRVIFSNGTESDPLMSSFRKSLNDDKTARMVQKVGLGPLDPDWEADQLEMTGTIYVARSRSEDPTIREQRMILHKIGVTSQDVQRRVADARNDPTFLLAPVEIVATYELKNLPRRRVEQLLHRFFATARPGELHVADRFGRKVHPKEWFYVLPEHVGQAAKMIGDGTLHQFYYDARQQEILRKADR